MNFLLSKSNILIFVVHILLSFSIYTFKDENLATTSSAQIVQNMQESERNMFNKQFSIYQGMQSGSVVKQLISNIDISNQNSEHKIQIYLNDSSEFSQDNIVVTAKYNIYWHYDSNGLIDAARINSVEQ